MHDTAIRTADQLKVAEHRRARRIAVRQLERADMYLGAVASLEMADDAAQGAIDRLRDDLDLLRRHLVDQGATSSVEP